MIFLLIQILAFIVAITIHEFAHAWMAYRLGDPTAKIQGRLSLNPLVHIDLVGTVLVPLILILSNIGFIVGWAKPVGYDPYNLKDPRRDAALISLSGPLTNILFAVLLSIVLRLSIIPFSPFSFLSGFLYPFIVLNISLGIFNLIPIHPLDGGKILVGLLSEETAREVDMFLSRFGTIILLFFIFPIFGGNSLISIIISPLIKLLINLLVPGSYIV